MMPNTPACLHIPVLYEESTAVISWETVDTADGYELDTWHNESFESGSRGKTWADISEAEQTWEYQNSEDTQMTWEQIQALPAQGLTWRDIEFMTTNWTDIESRTTDWLTHRNVPVRFTEYRGQGEPYPAPDQGLTWANLNSMEEIDWNAVAQRDLTWLDFRLLPSVGLNWHQLNSDNDSWQTFEDEYEDWKDLEFRDPRALTWSSLEGQCLTWDEILADSRFDSWESLEALPPDRETHRARVVEVPLYTKLSQYRVRSFVPDENDPEERDYSEYITTPLKFHRPRSLKKYRPPCIHLPPVFYEGERADIVWGELYGAQAYVLERRFDGGNYQVVYDGEGVVRFQPCDIMEKIRDANEHYVAIDYMTIGKKTVQYRVKAYNTTDSSQYIESEVCKVIPIFTREDSRTLNVNSGKYYALVLESRGVRRLSEVELRLTWDKNVLELLDIKAQDNRDDLDVETMPASPVTIVSQAPGEIRFRCAQSIASGKEWTGMITKAGFRAVCPGTARTTVRLS